jgi:hypothetical protein
MAAELIGQIAICRRYGICDETWRRWRFAGVTPRPVDVPGRPRWILTEVEDFFRGRRKPEGGRTFFRSAVRRRVA